MVKFTDLKKKKLDRAFIAFRKWSKKELAATILLELLWDAIVHVNIEKKIMDAARERHVIPLNSE